MFNEPNHAREPGLAAVEIGDDVNEQSIWVNCDFAFREHFGLRRAES